MAIWQASHPFTDNVQSGALLGAAAAHTHNIFAGMAFFIREWALKNYILKL
jgi:hypothetical protein